MGKGRYWAALVALILLGGKPVEPVNDAGGSEAEAGINAEKPTEGGEAPSIRGGAALEAENREPHATNDEYYAQADLEAQQSMAEWTRWMGIAAALGVALSMVGVYLIWRTWHATRVAADTSRKTYDAFIAAEDASLVVEFPRGTVVESVVDGVLQPDTYFLEVAVTNIGRSTARLHGWSFGDKRHREDFTLKPGDTKKMHGVEVEEPAEGFTMSLHYSSPLREHLTLDVDALLKVDKSRAPQVRARAYRSKLRQQPQRED